MGPASQAQLGPHRFPAVFQRKVPVPLAAAAVMLFLSSPMERETTRQGTGDRVGSDLNVLTLWPPSGTEAVLARMTQKRQDCCDHCWVVKEQASGMQ